MFVFQANFLLRNDPAAALKKIDDGLAIFDSLLAVQPKSFPHQIQKLNALTAKVDLLEQLKRSKEARKVIAQVVELGESIATSSPSMAWVRQRFVIFQSLELVYSVRDGETKDLDRRVEDLLKTLPRKREPNPLWNSLGDTVRYNVACAYSQATLFEPSDERERAAAKAIDVLADLDRAGHFTLPGKVVLVETDSDLDPLRDRADFKLLLARVKEKGPRPVAPPPRPVTSHRALP
jgi:tetratricopeptide (TPR) repeat protein